MQLMEAEAEVREFVCCLKEWSLKELQQDGRVLLGLRAVQSGDYYGQEVVKLFQAAPAGELGAGSQGGSTRGRGAGAGATASGSSEDEDAYDEALAELPQHALAPGDMVLLTKGAAGPLVDDGWAPDMLLGSVTERSKTWIKVAVDGMPSRDELGSTDWRLDRSVNTLTFERALLALPALWNRLPPNGAAAPTTPPRVVVRRSGLVELAAPAASLLTSLQNFYRRHDSSSQARRQHRGAFLGSAVTPLPLAPSRDVDWSLLRTDAGQMPDSAIAAARIILPDASRPDPAASASRLRELEQAGKLTAGPEHAPGQPHLRLDASQWQAVATAVLNPVCLLHGPPGIGKTTTIGGLLAFLKKRHGYKGKVLAAAQSNVAVDNMLETAQKLGGLRVLRIGQPAKVRSSLQAFTLKAQLDQAAATDPEIKELQKRRRRAQELFASLKPARRARSSAAGGAAPGVDAEDGGGSSSSDQDSVEDDRRLKDACRWAHEEMDGARRDLQRRLDSLAAQLVRDADVVGATCTASAGPELAGVAFDMVVIDEGSQASEPEALIPIVKGSRRVVLVGDHRQLPPVVKSQDAAAAGLSVSLFERLMDAGTPSSMLQVQYRSHPALMAFTNEHFYNGLLSSGVSAAARAPPPGCEELLPNPGVPVWFINVPGEEAATERGSKLNHVEARTVATLVQALVADAGLLPRQLGVISPYAAQVGLLARQLQGEGYSVNAAAGGAWEGGDDAGAGELEVKSVDGYQGREKDVILLSTVRANPQREVGFLDDWRRANVALSRARMMLVVVGHAGTLRASETWMAFLDYAEQHGCCEEAELEE